MSTFADPQNECPFHAIADGTFPGPGMWMMDISNRVGEQDWLTIGACLTHTGKCSVGDFLRVCRSPDDDWHYCDLDIEDQDDGFMPNESDLFAATENNPFGLIAGTLFNVKLNVASPNLGYVMDVNKQLMGVSIDVHTVVETNERSNDRKRRSVLKRVETADGKSLNVENTMRTIVAWLDKMNTKYAAQHGTDRLVWCEEASSARSEKGSVRGWFKHDVTDGLKRKVVANASEAILCMETVTGTDFYAEMKANFADYNVDLVESRGGEAKSSSSKGVAVSVSVPI